MAKKGSKKQSTPNLLSLIVGMIVLIGAIFASCQESNQPVVPTTPPPTVTAVAGVPTATKAAVMPTFVPVTLATSGNVTTINLPQGFGASKGFWQVFFTAPTGSRDPSTYVGGIDTQLVPVINSAQRTLDIAAFEWNLQSLTDAVLAAKARGVQVRIVGDDEHNVEDSTSLTNQLIAAGIPVVSDNRSALMHNKFMIVDSSLVVTGSWNFTINDTYRNNNNALYIRSRRAVENYQAEFNEMFEQNRFGPRSPANTPNTSFTQDGVPIQVYFSPEDGVLAPLITTLNSAQSSIRFMTFSFTDYDVAKAMLDRAAAGVNVQGIFETTGSQTEASELRTLFCAGIDARQDGNPFVLHHKVFIVDNRTVVTGSFNISTNATQSNDENLIIITDPDLAAQYLAEYDRRLKESKVPTAFTCS
jgi:phosphatidylserine/phosphatidylglycerophosphate/cardiolipin synthase-like enzyme